MDAFVRWLEATAMSEAIVGSRWLWPAAETVHFIGLALLLGAIGILDLRLLGMARSLPVKPLHRFVPWGVAGFVLNLITGSIFFIGAPSQYAHNVSFQLKIVLILLAGVNVLVFYLFLYREVADLGPGEDAPRAAKLVAGFSVTLWIGVTFFGRMLPFLGQAF